MISILGVDVYRGFSAYINDLSEAGKPGVQPLFVGRLTWPGDTENSDVVIKLYETATCGIANEAIGYLANSSYGVAQPKRAAILLLPQSALPQMSINMAPYIDVNTGMAACWITSFEQNAKPFSYIRKLPSFSEKQREIFYKSKFCQLLAGADHITGNNDRHDGNFLYIDDLKYLAIDQGSIGGSALWHTTWPDPMSRNQILALVTENLSNSQLATWQSNTVIEYQQMVSNWSATIIKIRSAITDLLSNEQIDTIADYMTLRAESNQFTESCGRLL